jgi:hypothetical protein
VESGGIMFGPLIEQYWAQKVAGFICARQTDLAGI